MHTKSTIQLIAADRILLEDETFTLFPFDSNNPDKLLIQSVQSFGILHPPIVLKTENDRYIVVAGKTRMKAALQLGPVNAFHCLCLPADTLKADIYPILLEDALLGTRFSIIEHAVFLNKARADCSLEELFDLMARMGYKPQQHVLDSILALLSLENDSLRAVHEGKIGPANARKLLQLPAADQKILVEIVSALRIGGSKQKKIIELCIGLVMRTKKSLSTILHQFYPDIIREQDGNKPQQAAHLLNWLHKEYFPNSSGAEARFTNRVSRLNLPPQCSIRHSKSFEDDSVELLIYFKTFNSMQTYLPGIIRTITSKSADQ